MKSGGEGRWDAVLFGEVQSRIVVSVKPGDVETEVKEIGGGGLGAGDGAGGGGGGDQAGDWDQG